MLYFCREPSVGFQELPSFNALLFEVVVTKHRRHLEFRNATDPTDQLKLILTTTTYQQRIDQVILFFNCYQSKGYAFVYDKSGQSVARR